MTAARQAAAAASSSHASRTSAGSAARYAVRQVTACTRAMSAASAGRASRTETSALPVRRGNGEVGSTPGSVGPRGGCRTHQAGSPAVGHPVIDRLPAALARRIALAAQGFADPRPGGAVDGRHLRRMTERLAVVQIDSVNVLSRAHYLPAFSRFGPYRRTAIDELAGRRRELFEYWAHEASFLPVRLHPYLRWR